MKYKESFFNVEVAYEEERTLVYNSYSQAVCWFDAETYSSFKNKTYIEPDTLIEDIIRLGFCVPSVEDEVQKFLNERKQAYLNHTHLEYVIAPTLKCNMQCIYCFENASKKCLSISEKDANTVVCFITEDIRRIKPKKVQIKWFGGEPTLEFGRIKLISSKLKENIEKENITYSSSIITNGFLLNGQMAKQLKEQCSVSSAQISLDGLKETYSKMRRVSPESFDIVINNILESADFLNINIRLNINHENMDEMKKLIYYLLVEKQLEHKIHVHPAFIREYAFNNVNNLYSEYDFEVQREKLLAELIDAGFEDSLWLPKNEKRLFFCPACRNASLAIGPDLNLYNCECLIGRNEYSVGDCYKGRMDTETNLLFSITDIPDKCNNCNLLPACGLGCTEQILIENEPINCKAVRQRLCSNVRLLLKRNRT